MTRKKSKEMIHSEATVQDNLPAYVKHLREELRKAKLHSRLLNAMINIAEEQLNIDIRKMSGTRQ
jgi:hypothetical protein